MAEVNRPFINGLHFFFTFLSWCASTIGFGGTLFSAGYTWIIFQGRVKLVTQFYWNRIYNPRISALLNTADPVNFDSYPPTIYAAQLDPERVCEACAGVSSAFVICMVFAWLGFLAGWILTLIRWADRHERWPCINNYDNEMLMELVLSIVSYVLYLIGTLIFTGGCFAVAAPSRDFSSVYPTGMVFIWLMLLAMPFAIYRFWQLRIDTKLSPPEKTKPKEFTSASPSSSSSSSSSSPPPRKEKAEEPPTRTIPRPEKKEKVEEPPSRTIPMPEKHTDKPTDHRPPPPPPGGARGGASKYAMGQECQAIWLEDGAWYKAKITAVKGGGRFQVLFTEYGQSQECTEDQLRPSK